MKRVLTSFVAVAFVVFAFSAVTAQAGSKDQHHSQHNSIMAAKTSVVRTVAASTSAVTTTAVSTIAATTIAGRAATTRAIRLPRPPFRTTRFLRAPRSSR